MISKFDILPVALSDGQTRAQVDNYFRKRLAVNPSAKDIRAARIATLRQFPELVDHYIALKEEDRDQASAESMKKTLDTRTVMRDLVQLLAGDLKGRTDFYSSPWSSFDEAHDAVATFKHYIEHQDGHKLINGGSSVRFSREADVQLFFGLLLQRSRFDINREPNNGRGPVDFKISAGAHDKSLVEFKLASSTALKRNLQKQVEIYEKANKTDKSIKVVIAYTKADQEKVDRVCKEIDAEMQLRPGTTAGRIVVIDARSDNKASASKA